MENEDITQPLDALMTRLGLGNADLVRVSTEQLSFKMVQKGRKGRHLTRNIQEKIFNALLKAKPGLQIRRRELFHYPMDETVVEKVNEAISLVGKKKIKYPRYIDLLLEAGVNHYAVHVAANHTTLYGVAGDAHIIRGPVISQAAAGIFDALAVRSAIDAAQKETIDYPTFLKRIHDAGVISYEVNLRQRKIVYKGEIESYKEDIPPAASQGPVTVTPSEAPKETAVTAKPAIKKVTKRKKKPGIVHTTRKARVAARKRFYKKKRRKRSL